MMAEHGKAGSIPNSLLHWCCQGHALRAACSHGALAGVSSLCLCAGAVIHLQKWWFLRISQFSGKDLNHVHRKEHTEGS